MLLLVGRAGDESQSDQTLGCLVERGREWVWLTPPTISCTIATQKSVSECPGQSRMGWRQDMLE